VFQLFLEICTIGLTTRILSDNVSKFLIFNYVKKLCWHCQWQCDSYW